MWWSTLDDGKETRNNPDPMGAQRVFAPGCRSLTVPPAMMAILATSVKPALVACARVGGSLTAQRRTMTATWPHAIRWALRATVTPLRPCRMEADVTMGIAVTSERHASWGFVLEAVLSIARPPTTNATPHRAPRPGQRETATSCSRDWTERSATMPTRVTSAILANSVFAREAGQQTVRVLVTNATSRPAI